MARTPKIRTSYSADAAFLMRLSQAVEKDPKRSPEWRAKIVAKLNDLATDLIQAAS